jgi:pyridoxal phosphate enzyme (YggS family)
VDVVVVTKSAPTTFFPLLAEAGVKDVGENRVQAAGARRPMAPASWTWHGIGHLQRNKAARALELFDVFHALDSLSLAERLEALLQGATRRWPVYVQINAAGDPRKGGVTPEEALPLLEKMASMPHLEVRGLMTMARDRAEPGDLRATFRMLRDLRDDAVRRGVGAVPASGLSMGMSNDFELAVEEGATVVRVGSAVFEGLLEEPPEDAPADAEGADA